MVKNAKIPDLKVVKDQTATPSLPLATNQPDAETFLYHVGKIERERAKVDLQRKSLKQVRRAAQDAGLILKDIDRVLKLRDEEPETVQEGFRRQMEYARWLGLSPAPQADLFEAAPSEADRWFEEGKSDGLQGLTAAGDRYDPASEAGQARLKGHAAGQEILLKRFKPLEAPAS